MSVLPDLRDRLEKALLRLSEKEGATVTMIEVARRLKLHRVDLYRAASGDPFYGKQSVDGKKRHPGGFGPKSKRRRRLEKFIERALA